MKAVACTDTKLSVVDLPTPRPDRGQVVIDVLRCGICGSDLHARHHSDEAADVAAEAGYDAFMRSDQQVVFGHEICGTIGDYVWYDTNHNGVLSTSELHVTIIVAG